MLWKAFPKNKHYMYTTTCSLIARLITRTLKQNKQTNKQRITPTNKETNKNKTKHWVLETIGAPVGWNILKLSARQRSTTSLLPSVHHHDHHRVCSISRPPYLEILPHFNFVISDHAPGSTIVLSILWCQIVCVLEVNKLSYTRKRRPWVSVEKGQMMNL